MQYARHRFYGNHVKPSYEVRKREMQQHYGEHPSRRADLTGAVIHCYFRKGLTLQDTAEILQITPEQVESAISIIHQNAE